jgi:uncharacterized protein (TIGR02594 family)
MLRMVAFCRPLLAALALGIAAIAATVSPASARPHHGASRYSNAYHHIGHHVRWQQARYHSRHQYRRVARQHDVLPMGESGFIIGSGFAGMAPDTGGTVRAARYQSRNSYRRIVRQARSERSASPIRTHGLESSYASVAPGTAGATGSETVVSSGSGSSLVAEARRYVGGNPTGRGSLWCARFMNMVLQHTGHRGTGSDMANSFASYGTRVSGPQVGAIAVMSRGRGGGHVGIITGVDKSGNPIMISGNNGNRVREAPVSRGRIYAYVMPN